jgi:hypothetical protein
MPAVFAGLFPALFPAAGIRGEADHIL